MRQTMVQSNKAHKTLNAMANETFDQTFGILSRMDHLLREVTVFVQNPAPTNAEDIKINNPEISPFDWHGKATLKPLKRGQGDLKQVVEMQLDSVGKATLTLSYNKTNNSYTAKLDVSLKNMPHELSLAIAQHNNDTLNTNDFDQLRNKTRAIIAQTLGSAFSEISLQKAAGTYKVPKQRWFSRKIKQVKTDK